MNRVAAEERIHTLEIPLSGGSLLVPSAAVAEVMNPLPLIPVPGAPPWVLGAMGWRSHPVPVVSFEGLLGQPVPGITSLSKLVVFYPLAGPRNWEFYALLAAFEPRPQPVANIEAEDPARLPDTPFIAAGVKVKDRVLFIPDFEGLRSAFYP